MDVLAILEIAIGITMIYLILSLVCTSLLEAVVGMSKLRPKTLRKSIVKLVGEDLTRDVYANSEVSALCGPKGQDPSYIPTDVFARSVLDVATGGEWRKSGGLPTVLRDKFVELVANGKGKESPENVVAEAKLGQKLTDLMDEANGDIEILKNKIELWFDRTGDRSKGWFKRTVNCWLVFLGFAIAALVNADTILIFQRLSDDPALRAAAVEIAIEQLDKEQIEAAADPEKPEDPATLAAVREQVGTVAPFIGWSNEDPLIKSWSKSSETVTLVLAKLVGLLLTAFAISLGAPFWFDLLQKLVNVRKSVAAEKAKDISKGAGGSDGKAATSDEDQDAADADPAYAGPMAGFSPMAAKSHLGNAYWLAKAADLAYETDSGKVEASIASWGMTAHTFETDDPGDKQLWGGVNVATIDTQGFIAIDDNAVLVCFRGTEPTKPADIVTDLDKGLVFAGAYGKGMVHEGFRKAIESVWPKITEIIDKHADRKQPVWFAGHSLGGALAVLAASRYDYLVRSSNKDAKQKIAAAEKKLEQKPDDADMIKHRHAALAQLRGRVAGAYTIGQPRVGNEVFAKDFNSRIADSHVRIINNRDIVPRVPLRAMNYDHSGTVLYLDEFGRLHRDPGLWLRLLDTVVISRAEVAKAREGVKDHNSRAYVDLLDRVRKSKSALTRLAVA